MSWNTIEKRSELCKDCKHLCIRIDASSLAQIVALVRLKKCTEAFFGPVCAAEKPRLEPASLFVYHWIGQLKLPWMTGAENALEVAHKQCALCVDEGKVTERLWYIHVEDL